MRLFIALVVVLSACTKSPSGDDDTNPDGSVDPGTPCSPTSPRTVEPEAFVAPAGFQDRATAFIDSAQHTLDIQMYLFTVNAISDRVVAAQARGVAVRVLLDPDEAGNDSTRTKLTAASVPTRNDPAIYQFAHAKYLIADGKTAMVMSANFNADAMTNERNYGLIHRDPTDLADLQAIFEMDWAAAGNEPPKVADLSCTRWIVSPNNSAQRILDLVNNAHATLDVEALYVSDTTIRDAIAAAKARGVAVRVILETSMDTSSTIPFLNSKSIEVHASAGFYLHAKLIIADGVSFIGSENFSVTSLSRNREVGALLFESSQESVPQNQFNTDWSSTPIAP